MNYKLMSTALFLILISVVTSEHLENSTVEITTVSPASRKVRADNNFVYAELITCAVRSDTACLVDVAEDFLEIKRNELLAQADQEVIKATGRADPDNTPSVLARSVEKLISELTGLFKNGLSSLFSSKEDEDENEVAGEQEKDADESDDAKDDGSSRDVGESRDITKKKKKKKPLKKLFALIKVGILAGIVVMKISLLIKIFEAALKFKLLLVGLGSVLIQAAKFWMDYKSKKDGHDESIVYKNPYENGGEWSGPGVPGEYHGRSDDSANYGQNLAYSQYKSE